MKLSKVDSRRIIALLERIAYQTSVHANRLEFEQYLQGIVYADQKIRDPRSKDYIPAMAKEINYASSIRKTERSDGNRRTSSRKAVRQEQGNEENVPSTTA